jgi:hypothetical protein
MNLMPTDNASIADNQQETVQVPYERELTSSAYYFTGFCCGEISCSLLRLSNRKSKTGGVYYTSDITITNADYSLLSEVNKIVCDNCGVISKVKGAYNLSFRGKRKTKIALAFFAKYPPIAGDLVLSRLALLNKAIEILERQKSHKRSLVIENQLEAIRLSFVQIKRTATPIYKFQQNNFDRNSIGYFLAGILDAEGSVGLKTNGSGKRQPFLAVAMKDKQIVELFKTFLNVGHIHLRPHEKMSHFEIGAKEEVLYALNLFLNEYPSRLAKAKQRIINLHRILNDYTLGPVLKPDKI